MTIKFNDIVAREEFEIFRAVRVFFRSACFSDKNK